MKYVSDLKELEGKVYSTVEDLEKAEESVNKAIAEKKAASIARRTDSEAVKDAIIDRVKSQRKAKDLKAQAYRDYLETIDSIDEMLENSYKNERDALTEFCKKYPDGFHDKITIDDVTFEYDYSTSATKTSALSLFDRLFTSNFWTF